MLVSVTGTSPLVPSVIKALELRGHVIPPPNQPSEATIVIDQDDEAVQNQAEIDVKAQNFARTGWEAADHPVIPAVAAAAVDYLELSGTPAEKILVHRERIDTATVIGWALDVVMEFEKVKVKGTPWWKSALKAIFGVLTRKKG